MHLFVDVSNVLYSSYHAFAGQLTGTTHAGAALYGFFKTIAARLKATPHYFMVFLCYDNGRSFRYDLYPEYKGKPPQDDEVYDIRNGVQEAMNMLRALAAYMPWLHCERPNTEADDMIAGLCRFYDKMPKQIISGDRDMYQLINRMTNVWNRHEKELIEEYNFQSLVKVKWTTGPTKKDPTKHVIEKFFTDPMMWFLYRVLTGDASDNIKGIPGLGPKYGYDLTRFLMQECSGRLSVLLEEPERVLGAAGVKTWKSIAGAIRANGAEIINRNLTLMSLVEAADRLSDLESHCFSGCYGTSPSGHVVGRDHFVNFLRLMKYPSVEAEIQLFDEMEMKSQQYRTLTSTSG